MKQVNFRIDIEQELHPRAQEIIKVEHNRTISAFAKEALVFYFKLSTTDNKRAFLEDQGII